MMCLKHTQQLNGSVLIYIGEILIENWEATEISSIVLNSYLVNMVVS